MVDCVAYALITRADRWDEGADAFVGANSIGWGGIWAAIGEPLRCGGDKTRVGDTGVLTEQNLLAHFDVSHLFTCALSCGG